MAKETVVYGPAAATSRAMLPNDEIRELFDWSTSQITDQMHLVLFQSMMQATACRNPSASYWSLVNHVKKIMEDKDFDVAQKAIMEQAEKNLAKKPD